MVFKFSLVHRLRSKLSLLVLQFTLVTVCCFRVGCVEATTLEATTTRHILRLSFAWMDTGRQIGFGYRPVVGKTNQYDRTAVIWRTDRRLDSEAVEMLREDLQASAGRWTGKEGAPQWTASPGGEADIITLSRCPSQTGSRRLQFKHRGKKLKTDIANIWQYLFYTQINNEDLAQHQWLKY